VPFAAGDIVHFTPKTVHQLVNDSEQEFQMYAIWWDTDLAAGYLHAHGTARAEGLVS
jgi:oxalate decarboxylase/phosphoglucose isomerase-like protein (cupin superfamily)